MCHCNWTRDIHLCVRITNIAVIVTFVTSLDKYEALIDYDVVTHNFMHPVRNHSASSLLARSAHEVRSTCDVTGSTAPYRVPKASQCIRKFIPCVCLSVELAERAP